MISSYFSKGVIGIAALALIITASAKPTIGVAGNPAKPGFTRDQASKGKTAFAANCAVCHGANLEGISGPALKGKDAALQDKSVHDIYTYTAANMPVGNAGGLPSPVYVNIMAFLLQSNGHRASSVKLTSATLKASSEKVGGAH